MWKKLLIAVILIGGVAFFFLGYKKEGETNSEARQVVVRPVTKQNMLKTIVADGTVEITNEEEIYISRSLRVDQVNFEEDDEVKKGDILITFDKEDRNDLIRQIEMKKIEIKNKKINLEEYKFEVSELNITQKESEIEDMKTQIEKYNKNLELAKAEEKRLKQELSNTEKDLKVKEKLFAIEGISETELDSVKLSKTKLEKSIVDNRWQQEEYSIDISETERNIKLAELELADAKKTYKEDIEKQKNNIERTENEIVTLELEIESLYEDLEKTVENVVSTVDGTIIELNAEENFKVNLEQSLMTIADINSQVITANISSKEIKYVELGQEVLITSDALDEGENIKGKISSISSMASTESGSGYEDIVVEIEITFDTTNTVLKPGYSVDIEIIVDEKENALTMPSFAIQIGGRGKFVYVVNEESVIEAALLDIGWQTDKMVEVLNLNEGEKVVMNPSGLKRGDKVEIVEKMTSKVSSKGNEAGQGNGTGPGMGGGRP